MAFKLDSVVPWGRNLEEYKLMFGLGDNDMSKKIAGFGDGPACFNCEMTNAGGHVVSFDPIYQFSKKEIEERIEEVRITVMQQMKENMDNYVWTHIKDLDELEHIRMSAMRKFLSDYEQGKKEGRYVFHELPVRLPYEAESFDIGLSSHFLLMYTALGYVFHIQSITEMLRVCKEIRIFPIVDLDANKTDLIKNVIDYFQKDYNTSIVITDYCHEMDNYGKILEFLKGAALRPYLDRLNEEEQKLFMDEVLKNLEIEYYYQANGKILFPIKRLFLVGQK